MTFPRRDLLKLAGGALAAGGALSIGAVPFTAQAAAADNLMPNQQWLSGFLNVRNFGATGDGLTIDTPAIDRAIQAAASAGGGTVIVPAGTYACYSIHLKSNVCLYLDQGATILAASVPLEGTTTGGYDAAEPQGPWEPYQDYGHNHWHNSLIWGEGLSNIGICGPGRIYGKGLSRGHKDDTDLPRVTAPGVGNKSIALKNCHNVILRDFSILQGGWFGILATGVDNFTVDNLKIDTNRDGMDIDCCRNVRVSNCTINSPYDDAICPKSSFALGFARPTENLTIANCYVTGGYEVGSLLDGTWKVRPQQFGTGRIKCGTESNGGFKNITITNCAFDRCWGIALETVDGAICEDITCSNIAMHNLRGAPFFLRLGARMRGPGNIPVGVLHRVVLSNITSSALRPLPALIAGIPSHPVEDVKISDLYLEQVGGEPQSAAAILPPEDATKYPEPTMFGDLPSTGVFMRHVRNVEVGCVEIAVRMPDARPAFWLDDVDGADFFRVRVPKGAPAFALTSVRDFRSFGAQFLKDVSLDSVTRRTI
ncbi:MAG TPA: glycoside hydrolase family 28 protein [Acidobacteriaceae bacterium]|nr:glycoside hydrolase family 28 protein [Acidobacteriaceae bacterium]